MLSHTAEYALRAVLALAAEPPDVTVGAAALADRLRLPRNYLSKTLHQLARAGVLESVRGKQGGFRLARKASRIPLMAVVAPFQDVGGRVCLLGQSVCSDHHACPAHARWKDVSDRAARFFRETTVADLVGAGSGTTG